MSLDVISREFTVSAGASRHRDPSIVAINDSLWALTWVAEPISNNLDIFGKVISDSGSSNSFGQFTVNTTLYASNAQTGNQISPEIVATGPADGPIGGRDGFVIAYADNQPFLSNGSNIIAIGHNFEGRYNGGTRINEAGTAPGSIQIDHSEPSATLLQNGNLVVAWHGFENPISPTGRDVFLNVVDRSGLVSDNIVVPMVLQGEQIRPSVTALSNGNFVVVWQSDSLLPTDGRDIRAQIFSPDAQAIGDELQINAITAGDQMNPDVSALPGGGFVVTWQDNSGLNGDVSNTGIAARLFDGIGNPITANELLVNDITGGIQSNAKVASFEGGGFIVVWQDNSQMSRSSSLFGADTSGFGIKAQIYNGLGIKAGSEFLINDTNKAFDQVSPDVATRADGTFIVTWQSNSSSFSGNGFIQANTWTIGLEDLNASPIILSNGGGDTASLETFENATFVSTFIAIDERPSELTYSILGGADQELFEIDAILGNLSFIIGPDFESPGDFDNDNVYEVQISVSDGSSSDSQALFITVNDVPETNIITGTPLNDALSGSGSDDIIQGLAGDDMLDGLAGNDLLEGGSNNDHLFGQEGDDVLSGGVGVDMLDGGTGFDIASYAGLANAVTANLSTGFTQKTRGGGTETLVWVEGVIGTSFDDSLTGNNEINRLEGGEGNDTITGGRGNDVLSGGQGEDVFRYTTGDGQDSIDGGAGTDTLRAKADGTRLSFASITDVELITSAGFSNVNLFGTASNDTIDLSGVTLDGIGFIDAGNGNDIVIGTAGDDVFRAGNGADVFTSGEGNDRYVFQSVSNGAASSFDTITDFVQGSDIIDLAGVDASSIASGNQAFSFIGSAAFSGTAGELRVLRAQNSGITRLQGDTNGDGVADFFVQLTGLYVLTTDDLVL